MGSASSCLLSVAPLKASADGDDGGEELLKKLAAQPGLISKPVPGLLVLLGGEAQTWVHIACERKQLQLVRRIFQFLGNSNLAIVREALGPYCCRTGLTLPGSVSEGLRLAAGMCNGKGQTPLMHAAYAGCPELVQYLLVQGANPWAKDRCGGRTALHYAAISGCVGSVAALLQSTATQQPTRGTIRFIDVASLSGMTTVHYAVFYERQHVLHVLLKYDPDISAATTGFGTDAIWMSDCESGSTALHFAAARGSMACALELLRHYAARRHGPSSLTDPRLARNSAGKQPWQVLTGQQSLHTLWAALQPDQPLPAVLVGSDEEGIGVGGLGPPSLASIAAAVLRLKLLSAVEAIGRNPACPDLAIAVASDERDSDAWGLENVQLIGESSTTGAAAVAALRNRTTTLRKAAVLPSAAAATAAAVISGPGSATWLGGCRCGGGTTRNLMLMGIYSDGGGGGSQGMLYDKSLGHSARRSLSMGSLPVRSCRQPGSAATVSLLHSPPAFSRGPHHHGRLRSQSHVQLEPQFCNRELVCQVSSRSLRGRFCGRPAHHPFGVQDAMEIHSGLKQDAEDGSRIDGAEGLKTRAAVPTVNTAELRLPSLNACSGGGGDGGIGSSSRSGCCYGGCGGGSGTTMAAAVAAACCCDLTVPSLRRLDAVSESPVSGCFRPGVPTSSRRSTLRRRVFSAAAPHVRSASVVTAAATGFYTTHGYYGCCACSGGGGGGSGHSFAGGSSGGRSGGGGVLGAGVVHWSALVDQKAPATSGAGGAASLWASVVASAAVDGDESVTESGGGGDTEDDDDYTDGGGSGGSSSTSICNVCFAHPETLTPAGCRHGLCTSCARQICHSLVDRPLLCPFCRRTVNDFVRLAPSPPPPLALR